MNLRKRVRNILVLIILLLSIGIASCVPADPTPFVLTQQDGSSFMARQVGDERGSHFETLDGYTIVKDENENWNYAKKDENGKLLSSGLKVGIEPEGISKHLHPDKPVELIQEDRISSDISSISRISQTSFASQTGNKKVLVILVSFTDVSPAPSYTPAYYQNLIFNTSPNSNSMYNYYKEVSYGKLNISGNIAGNKWYQLPKTMSWYGADVTGIDRDETKLNPNDRYIDKLAKDAVRAADNDVNYADYDTDKDGVIDHIIVIHAGNDQAETEITNDIWSHKSSIFEWDGVKWNLGITADGVKAIEYTTLAETSPLGTFAHEFGHDLGLPDLYDRDYTSIGVGSWDIMGYGGWLNNGNTPPHFSAWSKYFLGWVTPKKVISLLNQKINQSEFDDDVYMLLDNPNGISDWNRDGTGIGEYFLVENRRKIGYDAYLPGEGLLIWHIDESKGSNDDENHKLVDLEEADGLNDLDKKTNSGDAGDTWKNSINGFGDNSNPNSKFYNGTSSGVRVTYISASSSEMTANLMPPPLISFVYPVNNYMQSQNWTFVNITSDVSLVSAKLEWNGINETMIGSGKTWSINKSGLYDGTYKFKVHGKDIVNNWNVTETRTIIIDSRVPQIYVEILGAKTGSKVELNITISSESGVKNASVNVSSINNTLKNISLNNVSGQWTYPNITVDVSEGNYYLDIIAYNNIGLKSQEKIPFIVDNTQPVVKIFSPLNNSFVNNQTINISGNVSDNFGIIGVCIKRTWQNQGLIGVGGVCGGYGNILKEMDFNFPVILYEGWNNLILTFIDIAGNSGSAYVNVTLDTIKPNVTNLSISTYTPLISQYVNITANMTDEHLNTSGVFAEVKYPSGHKEIFNMSLGYYNFTNTTQFGRYDVTINASDFAGNFNNTEKILFVTIKTSSKNKLLNGGKGETANGSWKWNSTNFLDFVNNETLITNVQNRSIEIGNLSYNGYKIPEKLSIDKSITLGVGESSDIGNGYTLNAQSLDAKSRQAWIVLLKNDVKKDDVIIPEGKSHIYVLPNLTEELVIYVEKVFTVNTDVVTLNVIYLNQNKKVLYQKGDVFGNLVVNNRKLVGLTQYLDLKNNNSISLTKDSSTLILDDLYFRILDTENLSYYPYFNRAKKPDIVDILDNNISLELSVNNTIDGYINITEAKDIPIEFSGKKSMNKFVDINVSDNVRSHLEWVKIKLYYTQKELIDSGLDESSLKIVWFNEMSNKWELLSNQGVDTTDFENYTGHIWANISHLSSFALVGSEPTPSPNNRDSSSSSSSGGGGGGGGGASGEDYFNIDVKEKYDSHIFMDKETSYMFKDTKNPVMFVNITGNVNAGEINTAVEVLKNTSTLIKTSASGIVYKNLNIWVGTSGFAIPRNIKVAYIKFRVENTWIEENGLKNNEIRLLRWNGTKWLSLETSENSKDSKYTYFEARTNAFSPFAVIGLKERDDVKLSSQSFQSVEQPVKPENIENTPEPQTTAPKSSSSVGIILTLIVFYVLRKRRA